MKNLRIRKLVFASAVGALYALLVLATVWLPINFGPVQFRLSEALCVLPYCFPETIGGLFVGCVIGNLLSPYPLDIAVGAAATLLAALCSAKVRRKWLAPLPPVLLNGLIVGALIAWYETGFSAAFPAAFALNALSVAGGEALVCYALGLPLLYAMYRIPFFQKRIPPHRLKY